MESLISTIFNPFSFVLILLVAMSIHRLWIYEDVFKGMRNRMQLWLPWCKPLHCSSCFAFWAAVLSLACSPLMLHPFGQLAYLIVACYAPIRGLVGVYQWAQERQVPRTSPSVEMLKENAVVASPAQKKTTSRIVDGTKPRVLSPKDGAMIVSFSGTGCKQCEKNSKIMTPPPAHAADMKKLIHFTAFSNMHNGYSLVQVVLDQCRAALNKGIYVCVMVNDNFDLSTLPADLASNRNFMLKAVLPTFVWKENEISEEHVSPLADAYRKSMMCMGKGVAISHDLLFQSAFLTHAKAWHEVAAFKAWKIFHIAHSGPSAHQAEGDIRYRYSVPKGHNLLSLTYSDLQLLADQYQHPVDSIKVLQNPRDLLTLLGLPEITRKIVNEAGLLDVDIAQILPISVTRIRAKGITHILQTFAQIKKQGLTVKLLIIDAHFDSPAAKEARKRVETEIYDLHLHEDVAWLSDIDSSYSAGIPNEVVGSLFQYTNLFLFPTQAEASPLVVLEAALAGNFMVLNSDLAVLHDLIPHQMAMWESFGSARSQDTPQVDYYGLSERIIDALYDQSTLRIKRHVLVNFSIEGTGERIVSLYE